MLVTGISIHVRHLPPTPKTCSIQENSDNFVLSDNSGNVSWSQRLMYQEHTLQNHTDSNLSLENWFRLSRVKSKEEGFDLNPTTSTLTLTSLINWVTVSTNHLQNNYGQTLVKKDKKIVDINYSKLMSNQSDVDAFHSSGPIEPSNTKLFSVVVSYKNDQTKHNIN